MKILLLFLASNFYLYAYALPICNKVSIHCSKTPSVTIDDTGKFWGVFYYKKHLYLTHSHNQGKNFSEPVKINSVAEDIYTNGENRPKIAIGLQQQIYISWSAKTEGRFNGNIRFSKSTDNGLSFSVPVTINDDGLLTGHRFESLQITKSGLIYLIWIDKRDKVLAKKKGKEYSGAAIYYTVSNDGGENFSKNKKIIDHSCECCRIVTSPLGDDIVAMWRNIFDTNTRDHALSLLTSSIQSDIASPKIYRATIDDWKIDACPHHGPDISSSKDQELHMAWFSDGTINQGLSYGLFDLSQKKLIRQNNIDKSPSASHPQVLYANSSVYYLWKRFDGEKTQLLLKTSNDKGVTWEESKRIHSTTEENDHPFLISHNNEVYYTWLTGEKFVVEQIK